MINSFNNKKEEKKENRKIAINKNVTLFGALFLFPIIIIHILFKVNLGIKIFEATWESGDLLNYTASFYILICTVIIAKNQNNLLISQNRIQEEQVRISKRQDKIEKYSRAIDIKLLTITGNVNAFTICLECDKKEDILDINFRKASFKAWNAGNSYFNNDCSINPYTSTETNMGWEIPVHFDIDCRNKFEDSKIVLVYDYKNKYSDKYEIEMEISYDWVNKLVKKKVVKYCDKDL